MENYEGRERQNGLTPAPGREKTGEPPPSGWAWLVRNGPLLAVAVALLVYVCLKLNPLTILLVAVGLGLVIFIHELGHFLIAKWCDVHVETFSIGFGPPIPGCSFRRGETTYMIALFPLGGYVKMVGEGPEAEEDEDDPRSFKNKPIWQRMAIISAGVTMNVLLGCVCFSIAYLHGVKPQPAVVGHVDVGSAAWETGIPTGAVIERIGNARKPYFDDVRPQVMLSTKGEKLPLDYRLPGRPPVATEIEPRRAEQSTHPVIGISPPPELKLLPKQAQKEHELPVLYQSAAARAEPPFQFGDTIIGMTDPETAGRVTELPWDPRDPHPHSRDYFEFHRRMELLAGKPVTIRVQRQAGGSNEMVDVHVPAAFHYVFKGMRMRMGKVTAIRHDSPAQRAGVSRGDILKKLAIKDAQGQTIRSFQVENVDPLRLPYDLQQQIEKTPGAQIVITVLKENEPKPIELKPVAWDHGWRFDQQYPLSLASPLAIPGLGVGYHVETTVDDLQKDSPAERAGLKKDDVIREVRFKNAGKKPGEGEWGDWIKLWSRQDDQEVSQHWWAFVFWELQGRDEKELQVKVKRDKEDSSEPIELTAEEDKDWPMTGSVTGRAITASRGLLLLSDWRLQKAENLGQALHMGLHKTYNFIIQVYGYLRSIVTRRVSLETLGGPITIARMAYYIGGADFYEFLIFLGIISVNLAVINFLPIPVLDGGHMIFLIYEKLRGKPAPELVRNYATFIGLALIICLMVFVVYLDIKRL